MIYIEKHPSAVVAYEKELSVNQLDMLSLTDPSVHPTMKGADVYDQVRSFNEFDNLKNQLLQDQGGVCCYCGCRLPHPLGVPYIVEHVVPKSVDRKLAGEYTNMLLSCRGGIDDKNKAQLETLPKKEIKKNTHCDRSKGSKPLGYTPLQKDCSIHFLYSIDGTIKGSDAAAQRDIKVLHLDCDYLNDRRKAAIESFIFDDSNVALTENELKAISQGLMTRPQNGVFHEYYFVISDAIQRFLS